jgi:prepilin signal peptidase PulO-like enzyme (type II secretory pathway)
MIIIFLFCLGVLIGSFLNVLGLRWNSGKTMGGRSLCFTCGKKLNSWELIPLVSFLLQKGKCRGCKAKISWQYPLIELLTGLIFATLYIAIASDTTLPFVWVIGLWALVTSIFCVYVVITIYDLRHKIIPDSLVYTSIFLSLIYRIIVGGSIFDWIAGPILFLFFALIWLVSRGRAMGFGDAKLSLSVGLMLGANLSYSAFVLSFWIGALCALGLMLLVRLGALSQRGKRLTMKSEIPFAPFIVLGAWIALILHFNILHVTFF